MAQISTETWTRYIELARISKAIYAGPIRHTLYTYYGQPIKKQKIVHGSFGRGYCRIFWNDTNLIIAFRGTREKTDWRVSNLKAWPVLLRDCPEQTNIKVHRGFQNTLDFGDKTTESRSLDAIFNHLSHYKLLNHQVTIVGHSLGGALAILFAAKFRARWPEECSQNLIEIITFGSPAVGLKSFKNFYGELSSKTTRIVNGADGVPFTPPLFYCHVGDEIWLQNQTTSANVGWVRRLLYALRTPFSLSLDHSMTEYISRLKTEIGQNTSSIKNSVAPQLMEVT